MNKFSLVFVLIVSSCATEYKESDSRAVSGCGRAAASTVEKRVETTEKKIDSLEAVQKKQEHRFACFEAELRYFKEIMLLLHRLN